MTYAAGVLSLGQLYCVAFIVGVSTVFFDIAYQSYLPELIGRDDLVEGNAKLQASHSVAAVAGHSVGGALVQALTAPYALLGDGSAAGSHAEPAARPDRSHHLRRGRRRPAGRRCRDAGGPRIGQGPAICASDARASHRCLAPVQG